MSVGLSGEIDNLSARLSSEISGLSVEFSGLISSVSSDITGMISSISSDLNTDLSGLSGDYVAVKDLVNRTVYDPGDSKPGVIKILDEYQYGGESGLRNYEMHMISGTVKLVKIA